MDSFEFPAIRRGVNDQRITFKRPNGQIIDVSNSPRVDALARLLRPWPGSKWLFIHDGTYYVKFADETMMTGKTSDSFPTLEMTIL